MRVVSSPAPEDKGAAATSSERRAALGLVSSSATILGVPWYNCISPALLRLTTVAHNLSLRFYLQPDKVPCSLFCWIDSFLLLLLIYRGSSCKSLISDGHYECNVHGLIVPLISRSFNV